MAGLGQDERVDGGDSSRAFWALLPAWLLYNALSPLLLLALLPGWLKRARARGAWAEAWRERLGWPEKPLREWAKQSRPVWIHAVSVGECGVLIKLLQQWLEQQNGAGEELANATHQAIAPSQPASRECFVLTTTTATGRRVLESFVKRLPEEQQQRVRICWAPLDLLPCAWLAERAFVPRMLLLSEAEWWPNWLSLANWRGVPCALFHARLSPRSAGRLEKFRWLVGPILRQLRWVGVQSEQEKAPWLKLGLRPERVQVTGSVKYEQAQACPTVGVPAEFAELLGKLGANSSAPVLVGVSTFAGEEQLLVEVVEALAKQGQELRLLLVPRHAERAAELHSQLEELGWQLVLRHPLCSSLASRPANAEPSQVKKLLLINSTGELRQWLRLADVAVIGKSWKRGQKGGQNPVEALEAGALPICGPEMNNFAALVEELKGVGALEQIHGEAEELAGKLQAKLSEVLAQSQLRAEAIERGLKQLNRHQGAAQKTVQALRELL